MRILITGSAGLIGSEAVRFYKGHEIIGIDNFQRSKWFGTPRVRIEQDGYTHRYADIRVYHQLEEIFNEPFDYILHTAGQPSHDLSATIPLEDFEVNALGTLNLLELTRKHSPNAVFIFTSTNKVYGDRPNNLYLKVDGKRYTPDNEYFEDGFSENLDVDQCTHSPFGVSKLAADVYCQEYGRYFGLKTGIFRGGCLTGGHHQGAELHGFLNYLIKCAKYDKPYKIYGNGLQVRDNIHAYDLITAFEEFRKNPKPGEVYNIGGGTYSNCSILEAIDMISEFRESPYTNYTIHEDLWRKGDHKYYISDVTKFQSHYPDWKYTYNIKQIIQEIYSNV